MIIAGVIIETSKNDRLKPTAKASMLVAMDNITKTEKLEELTIFFDSAVVAS
jgi:hypothetical protein